MTPEQFVRMFHPNAAIKIVGEDYGNAPEQY